MFIASSRSLLDSVLALDSLALSYLRAEFSWLALASAFLRISISFNCKSCEGLLRVDVLGTKGFLTFAV